MNLKLILSIIIFTMGILSCSQKEYLYPTLAYDLHERDFKELDRVFKNVHKIQNPNLETFIERIGLIEQTSLLSGKYISSRTVFQAFIDEKGDIETVFIIKLANIELFDLSYDMLASHAFLQSKFRPIEINNKRVKYFLIINYPIIKGKLMTPIINGISADNLIKNGKFYVDKSNDQHGSEIEKVNTFKIDSSVKIFDFKSLNVKPKLLKPIQPIYPDILRKAGIGGTVVLNIIIDESGKVIHTEVVESAETLLDRSALKAAKELIFLPGYYAGKPVKVKLRIPFHFNNR